MNFFVTFRDLVTISDTSIKNIGDTVGYASSYISKWHNGKNLPAQRSAQEVIAKLGEYFAENIQTDEQMQELLLRYPQLAGPLRSKPLGSILTSLLLDGYHISLDENRMAYTYEGPGSAALQITGQKALMDYVLAGVY